MGSWGFHVCLTHSSFGPKANIAAPFTAAPLTAWDSCFRTGSAMWDGAPSAAQGFSGSLGACTTPAEIPLDSHEWATLYVRCDGNNHHYKAIFKELIGAHAETGAHAANLGQASPSTSRDKIVTSFKQPFWCWKARKCSHIRINDLN